MDVPMSAVDNNVFATSWFTLFAATTMEVLTIGLKIAFGFMFVPRGCRVPCLLAPRLSTYGSQHLGATLGRACKRRISTTSLSASLNPNNDPLNVLGRHEHCFVSYFTDVEGDKEYLDRYVRNSKVLTFEPNPTVKRKDSSPPKSPYFSALPYTQRIAFSETNAVLVYGVSMTMIIPLLCMPSRITDYLYEYDI